MKIAIDMASTAGKKTGLGMYTEQCCAAMRARSSRHEFLPITTVKKNLRTPQRLLWDQVGLPLIAWMKKCDALFIPAFSCPRFPKPMVMTVHDIIGVVHPEYFLSPTARFYWTRVLPRSLQRADRLIAISEHTKNDLVEHLRIPAGRITVIPNAVDPAFHVLEDAAHIPELLARHGVTLPFILSVGTQEPRKNYPRLIEVFAFAQRGNTQLVIVGKKSWGSADIQKVIEKYRLHKSVRLLEYIPTQELIALYNACLFFIMPSLYEGFGLPVLEAMQCGAPVIVAQTTSLPEVVGDAGMLVDPSDVAAMREKMDILLHDDERRSIMQQQSAARAKKFSWQHTAQETLKVFDAL